MRDEGPSSTEHPGAGLPAGGRFTGRPRAKKTKRSVRVADVVSQLLITIGGIGTIVAVATVCIFLALVVLPLFRGAKADVRLGPDGDGRAAAGETVHLAADEYLTIALTVSRAGEFVTHRLDDGSELDRVRPFADLDASPVAWSFDDGPLAVAGFDDGSLALLRIGFRTSFPSEDVVDEALFALEPGAYDAWRGGTLQRTVEGQFRWQRLELEVVAVIEGRGEGPVLDLDHVGTTDEATVLARDAAGLRALPGAAREDFMTGERTFVFRRPIEVPMVARDAVGPIACRLDGAATMAYVGWGDGTIDRFRLRTVSGPLLVETVDAVEAADRRLTAMEFLLGGSTLITGDSAGGLRGWFPAPLPDADRRALDEAATAGEGEERHVEGFALVGAKTLDTTARAPVRAIAPSSRTRMIAAGFDDGSIETHYLVSADRLLAIEAPVDGPIERLSISPKQDALLAVADGRLVAWDFDPRYPEASATTIFSPIWYEGYSEPGFSWQSSAAVDTFEPKLSLAPLIFGTLKATFYSMIFGAPIALLAAIYTSEFLHPRARQIVKPTIELMASLPSVILGFLAALVFAPFVERVVPAVVVGFVAIPLALLVGAFLWQLLPRDVAIRIERYRLLVVLGLLPVGIAIAGLLGPVAERLLFGGNLRLWLNGLRAGTPDAYGGPLGGWIVLLLPVAALATAWVGARFLSPVLRRRLRTADRRTAALVDLGRFGGLVLASLLVAVTFGLGLSAIGLDVRGPLPNLGSFVDTYDQRNALIVGFVMGFAIIPIIYTIADDALSTVPDHLRSASLGAGATPWQTAVRIVIPTAMSGLFSALMIGLGRAVGETMIVLMALGNTPVMNMNVFEGARTLSANIAVELPEAPIGSTHYRVLFLAALTLFAMTFVVNTIAEVVRLRFRKRAYQL